MRLPALVKQLLEQPATPILEAVAGAVVKVAGRVRLQGERLKAPITGERCAFYHARVESFSRTYQAWVPFVDERRGAQFMLVDETGGALVLGDDASFDIDASHGDATRYAHEHTDRLERLLRRHRESCTGPLGPRALRHCEVTLRTDDRVVVVGVAHLRDNPDARPEDAPHGYRGRARRLVLEPEPLVVIRSSG